jgi:hypothetical protein
MDLKKIIRDGLSRINHGSNTMTFFHGGNLDFLDYNYEQPAKKTKYGTGLYFISRYDIASKYAKGNRKKYLVEIEKGNDISNMFFEKDKVLDFLSLSFSIAKKRMIINLLNTYKNTEKYIPAELFNNILINHELITPKNLINIRNFLVENGIDYEHVKNYYGFGEDMLVLYNLKKIKDIKWIGPKDKLDFFEIKNDI